MKISKQQLLKKSDAPIQVQKWFDRINDAPVSPANPDDRLSSWRDMVGKAFYELTGRSIEPLIPPSPEFDYGDWNPPSDEDRQLLDEAHEKALADLEEKTKRFPILHSYLFEPENSSASASDQKKGGLNARKYEYGKSADRRYENFLEIRSGIVTIARKAMSYQKKKFSLESEALLERLGFKRLDKKYQTELVIRDGRFKFESELTQIVELIPPERLRICPICNDVFWAKRIETNVCSKKKCSNNFHQRKIRIADYEKRLETEQKKYEKMVSTLKPEDKLIKAQRDMVNELIMKISQEKMKNGNL